MIRFLLGNKIVNLKALAIVILTPLLLGTGLYFVHAFQVKRNAQDLYDQALQLEKEGQVAKAVKVLEQYLGMVPSDTPALAKFGMWLAQDAKSSRARQRAMLVLDQVLRRDPLRTDVRRKVVELALSIGQFSAAREHLAVLYSLNKDDPDVLHWYARCEVGAGDSFKASEWFVKATKVAPLRVELALDYAMFLRFVQKSPGQADDEIERLIRADPKSAAVRMQAARYYLRVAELGLADKHMRYALNDLRLATVEAYLLAVDIAMAQAKPEEAQDFLEKGRKLYPQDVELRQKSSEVKIALGQRKEALALLEPLLANLPDDPDKLFALASDCIAAGGVEQATVVIARMAAKWPGPQVEFLQARVLMHKESWGEACKILEATAPRIKQGAPLGKHAYVMLAECYQRLGNPDKWLDACSAAVARDEDWPPARRALADALAAQGKFDQALHEYQKLPPAPDLPLKLAAVHMARNLRLPERERHWNEVDGILAKLSDKDKEKLEVKLLKANLFAAQKKYDDARKLMDAERLRDPKQIDPWMFLIQLAELQQRTQEVKALLAEAEKAVGPRVEWQFFQAQKALKKGDPDARKELAVIENATATLSPAGANRLRAVLAEHHLTLGHGSDAERLWKELATNQPKNLGVRLRLLDRYYQQNKDVELVSVVEEIRRIEGGPGVLTCYGEAAHHMLRAKNGNPKALVEVRQWLTKTSNARPSWSRVPLMEAEAFDLEGLKERALEKYKQALDRGESRLVVIRRALQLMYEQRLYGEASALLHRMPDQVISDVGLDRFAAQLMLVSPPDASADPHKTNLKALDLARKSINKDSKDYREYLWLGQVAALAKDLKEAEAAFRKAVEINDLIPDTWATLVLFLAGTKETVQAEAELAKAQKKLPPDKAALVLAPAYEAMGKLELAEKQYLEAMKTDPNDAQGLRNFAGFLSRTGQSTKAEVVLRKLLEPQTKAAKDTAAWARRTLALTLVFRGGYLRFKDAQTLLEQNRKDQPDQLEDQLANAIVLASQPAHRQEAIQACENIATKLATLRPEVQFFLAQLYEADGNWRLSKNQLVMLLANQDKNPVFLAHYTRALLRHNELDAAQTTVKKLAEVAPTAWQTFELRSRVLQAKGQKDEAKKLALEYAKQKDARLDLAAMLLDELDHAAEAENLFREFTKASKQPEAVLLLAQHLAKHKRVDEALAVCEEAWKTVPPERVVHCAVVVLRLGKGTPEQQAKVESWLTKAAAAQPKGMMVAILHAEVEDIRGRYAEAANLYRQILQKEPENIIALNNLAFLMALKKENLQDCMTMIDKAIAIAGPQAQLLDTQAVVLLQAGQSQKAVQVLQQAIAQGGGAEYYFHLALAQRQAKNQVAAVEAMRKARELGIRVEQVHALERGVFEEVLKELG